MTRSPPRIRLGDLSVGFVQPLAAALRDRGHDPLPLLDRYGLDAVRLGQAGARLSIPRYMHLGHAAIALTGDPALGLHMAPFSHLAHAGLAGVAAAQAPTVGEAAHTLIRYEALYAANYRGQCSIEEDAGGAWLQFYSISPYNAYNRFVVDSLLAGWLHQFGKLVGRPLQAERLQVEFAAPRYASAYTPLSKTPVHFAAKHNRLYLDAATLALPNPLHCPSTWQHLLALCEAECAQRTRVRTLAERVSHWLGPRLQGGNEPDLETAAKALHLPTWTLRRKLAEEGTRFRDLLNETRRDLAETYIRDTSLAFGEIAYLLGFASAEAFQRAFKRWTGFTPGTYRRTQRRG